MNGRARTVIGVMPASFRLPNDYASLRPTEAWVPEVVDPANLGAWGSRSYSGLARLKDDVSPAAAIERAAAWSRRDGCKAGYVRARPDGSLGGLARRVIPAQEFITGQVRGSLLILFGSVGVRAADRVRERREPAAGARRRAAPRSRGAHRARRRPRADRLAAADRERAARRSPAPPPASRWRGPACRSSSRCGRRTCRASTRRRSTARCWSSPRFSRSSPASCSACCRRCSCRVPTSPAC